MGGSASFSGQFGPPPLSPLREMEDFATAGLLVDLWAHQGTFPVPVDSKIIKHCGSKAAILIAMRGSLLFTAPQEVIILKGGDPVFQGEKKIDETHEGEMWIANSVHWGDEGDEAALWAVSPEDSSIGAWLHFGNVRSGPKGRVTEEMLEWAP